MITDSTKTSHNHVSASKCKWRSKAALCVNNTAWKKEVKICHLLLEKIDFLIYEQHLLDEF